MKVKLKRLFKAFVIAIAILFVCFMIGTGFECMFDFLESFCGPVVEIAARTVIVVVLVTYFAYVLVRDHEQERNEK